jgi:hypothetical protein
MTQPIAAGALQADGTLRPEPRMDVANVARAVRYMADLPLDANLATIRRPAPTRSVQIELANLWQTAIAALGHATGQMLDSA